MRNKITFFPFKHFFHQNESETKRLKDSVKITNFFINEASEIPSYIFIGEHGVAEEILNATKSHERTNPVTYLKPENTSEERYVLNNKNSYGSDYINVHDYDIDCLR